jgi:hypothetical protein
VGKLLFGGGWWWGRREGLFWLGFCFCGWQLHYYIAGHKNSFVGEWFCFLGGKKERKKERKKSEHHLPVKQGKLFIFGCK